MSEKKEYHTNEVIDITKNSVILKKEIPLQEGKTTTRGEFPKLNSDDNCKYPERACCNYGEFFERCPYMKCISMGNWKCTFNKNVKTKKKS